MFDTLSKAGKYLGQAAKMMIGVPDYDNYVEHMRITHPDQTPMTYEEFFPRAAGCALWWKRRRALLLRVARPDKRNVTRLYSEKFNFFKRRTQGVWR